VVAANVARSLGATDLALGYTTYQSDWPEQTPIAIESLTAVLKEYRIRLLLPVRDLASREQATSELETSGLSTLSLEQKCSRQITNVKLEEEKLRSQVALWQGAIRTSLCQIDGIESHILSDDIVGRVA
jgi:FtsZ-binding cell division protein ZapB